MTTERIWPRAGLLIALSLLTACVAAFAASSKPDEPSQSFQSLLNPGHGSWLGLVITDTREETAKELKLPNVTGAIVTSVIAGSPAEKAGFQPNDVILEFDGQRVRSAAQLQRLIKETPPDRTVSIQISRQGKLQTLQAKIENRGPSALLETPNVRIWPWPAYKLPQQPEQPEPFVEPLPKGKIMPVPPEMPKFYLGPLPNAQSQPLPKPFIEPGPKGEMPSPSTPFRSPFPAPENSLGISGDDLTPQLARFFGVKQGKGVLVSRVDPSSPASAAGLKAGDVIVRVGSQQVGSMSELQWALLTQPNKQHKITLGIVRDRREREMSILLSPGRNSIKPEPIMARRVQQW